MALNYTGSDGDDIPGSLYDTYNGLGGNDEMIGTPTANTMYGGDGNDVAKGSFALTTTGTGTINDPFFDTVLGPSGADILDGGTGSDLLNAGDGEDKLYGGEGDDSGVFAGYFGTYWVGGLYGGAGNDDLYGGGGNDLLQGDAGTDRLFGGTDADVFRFKLATDSAKGAARDVIYDFSHKEHDKVDLSPIDPKAKPGDQAFKFIGGEDFHHKAGEVRFANHKVFVDVDGNGKTDFQIGVFGVDKMVKFDFIL